MRVAKLPKSNYRLEMEAEEKMSKAAGCPPGHTYNPVVKKCFPGSPLPVMGGQTGGNSGNSGGSADAAIGAEVAMRQSQGLK